MKTQPQPKKEEDTTNALLRIWPPRQRTRDAVVTRLIETLSTPSILSNRYGTLPADEAATAARAIEEEAFGVASAASSEEDDGIEILSLYSKEISKRMLESIKARAAAAPSPTSNSVDPTANRVVSATEDVSSASM